MDEPMLEVISGDEVVLSFPQVPSFQAIATQIQPPFSLKYIDPATNEYEYIDNEEDLTKALETGSPTLQVFLSYPQSPEPELLFSCLYCQTALPTADSLCLDCQTENWDAWFIGKYGEEAWTRYQEEAEPRPKLAAAFSFGPNLGPREIDQEGKELNSEEEAQILEAEREDQKQDSFDQEEKQVTAPVIEEVKGRKEADRVKASDHGSLLEYGSQPDSIRDFPQQDDLAIDRILETGEKEEKQRVGEADRLEEMKEADLDSPESEGNRESQRTEQFPVPHLTESPVGERVRPRDYPVTSSYRSGLTSSPYLSLEPKEIHNRKYCKICQSRSSQLSLRYGESTSQRNPSSPNYRNPSYSLVQSSRISSSRPLVRPSVAVSYPRTSQYRSYYGLPKERESMQKCFYCSHSFPWYEETCGKCEVRKSLLRQPESDYKRKVMQWC